MSSPSNQCQTIQSSTDVVGIGIRINFYYTMVFLAVFPRTPSTEELLNKLYTNAGIAGFGLLLTAIIQTAKRQLTLFDALFVLHILFFLGTGVSPIGKYHWTRGRIAMGILLQFISVIAFTVWGLYVWIKAKDYGVQNGCNLNNEIKYVIFFANVRATKLWLRVIWIVVLSLSAVGLMLSFGVKAIKLFGMKAEVDQAEETDPVAHRGIPTESPGTESHAESEETPEETLEVWPEKPWYRYVSFTHLFFAIYSTIMLELMVHRNSSNHGGVVQFDEAWEFGQVLPVVMIFVNINEFVHFLFGFFGSRRLRLARNRRRRAQAEEAAHQAEGHSGPVFYRPRGSASGSNAFTRDQAPDKISAYELQNLNKTNTEVSESIVISNSQALHQPIGTLR